jgi:hypothetical protein
MWWFLLGRTWASNLAVPGTYPTIDLAVAASAPGDVVEIDAAGGPYLELVVVPHALTFRGIGRAVLQGTATADGFFRVDAPGAVVTLEGLELDGRGDFPALRLLQGSVVLDDVVVHDCEQTDAGGAIYAGTGATLLEIRDSVLRDSRNDDGTQAGGIIAVLGGDLRIERSILMRGSTDKYGGLVWYDGDGTFDLTDSLLDSGRALSRGGAVASTGETHILRTRFTGNRTESERGGGALYLEGSVLYDVLDSWFVSNSSTNDEGGGAIYLRSGTASVQGSVFCSNSADEGGAIRVHGGSFEVSHSAFIGNGAAVAGGALWNGGSASLVHVSATGNASPIGATAWSRASALTVRDAYLAYSGSGITLDSLSSGHTTVQGSALWGNAGTWDAQTLDFGGNLFDDPQLAAVTACDPLSLMPGNTSPLQDAASDGADIGAFDGIGAWPDSDADGVPSLFDCDDTSAAQGASTPEAIGDGIDQSCDGFEVCFFDSDLDQHGEELLLYSLDLDCTDPGEAPLQDDTCPGGDDNLDPDGDGTPSDCDDCPFSATGDSDDDGVCDDADLCPGYPETDGDGDGMPDDCDWCPLDEFNDRDSDTVCDSDDICPGQDDLLDTDGDTVPNGCEEECLLGDDDGDGVANDCDVCPAGDDALDYDNDLQPDDCDACPQDSPNDSDGDSICDSDDLCEGHNDAQDFDQDLQPDACDPCPLDPADDTDADGLCDSEDACPLDATDDSDGDGLCDSEDLCPGQDDRLDLDEDGLPDACDGCDGPGADADGDSRCDGEDLCPGEDDRLDADADGVPDGCDGCEDIPCGSRPGPAPDPAPFTVGCACDNTGSPELVGWLLALVWVRRRVPSSPARA